MQHARHITQYSDSLLMPCQLKTMCIARNIEYGINMITEQSVMAPESTISTPHGAMTNDSAATLKTPLFRVHIFEIKITIR